MYKSQKRYGGSIFIQNILTDMFDTTLLTHIKLLLKGAVDQGPVVQSVVSLTSSLRVISLTVIADSIYNILIFFAEKM